MQQITRQKMKTRDKLLRPSGSVQHFLITYPFLYSVVILGSGTYDNDTKYHEKNW